MQDFSKLRVWQHGHELVLRIYQATRHFPPDELYGLTSQLRRAGISIPSNIAEGCGRSSDADFARCLHVAMGSACEAEYQLLLASDLGYLSREAFDDLTRGTIEVKQQLASLLTRLKGTGKAKTAKESASQ